jgi:hypothetical protein
MSYQESPREVSAPGAHFLPVAGVAGLACAAVGLVIGFLEAGAPPFNAPLPEVLTFLRDASGMLSASSILRFALLPLLPFIAVGIYVWLGPKADAWRLVGLFGLALVLAVGFPANSAATIALWRLPVLEEQPQSLTMLWSMNVVWFFGAVMSWGIGVGSFSVAGWRSGRMPRWLSALGLLIGAVGVFCGIGVNALVSRELLAGAVLSMFGLLLPVWLVATSIMLIRDGRAPRPLMDEAAAAAT